MKLLTFLGTGNYQPTTYVWTPEGGGPREHTSPYAPAATCAFLRPEIVVLLATSQAALMHEERLRQELGPGVQVRAAPIPEGCDESELWAVFGALAGCVEPGEAVALDVTHGYRSLPLVAVLAGAFLRTARQVRVQHILYGAWEARDQSASPPRAPIFDLTPMFSLLEWAVAADQFVRLGDARDMAQLLQAAKPPHAAQQADAALHKRGQQMGAMARSLREVSDHLRLNRTHGALEAAHALCQRLAQVEAAYAAARPFAELLGQIQVAFAGLALEHPARPENAGPNLARQRALIRWYWERQHYVQAATLAREWVVSWVAAERGGRDIARKEFREGAERLLGEMHAAAKAGPNGARLRLMGAPAGVDLAQLWGRLADVRNDINHAGMRGGALTPQKLVEAIAWCLQEIEKLPLPGQ